MKIVTKKKGGPVFLKDRGMLKKIYCFYYSIKIRHFTRRMTI